MVKIKPNVPPPNAERFWNRDVSAGNVIINIRNVFHLASQPFCVLTGVSHCPHYLGIQSNTFHCRKSHRYWLRAAFCLSAVKEIFVNGAHKKHSHMIQTGNKCRPKQTAVRCQQKYKSRHKCHRIKKSASNIYKVNRCFVEGECGNLFVARGLWLTFCKQTQWRFESTMCPLA